jgi:hypothetical protein
MPKVRRSNLPRPLFRHLLERVEEREISTDQLELILDWMEMEPDVPNGQWFKRFSRVTVCGEGELVKTFLGADQAPIGDELR